MEKFDLLHKVEDLVEQNKRQQAFQQHFNNTDQKTIDFINKIKRYVTPTKISFFVFSYFYREITEVEAKTKNLSDMSKELKLSKQLYEQTVFLRNKIKDLQMEKQLAEKQIIGIQSNLKMKSFF